MAYSVGTITIPARLQDGREKKKGAGEKGMFPPPLRRGASWGTLRPHSRKPIVGGRLLEHLPKVRMMCVEKTTYTHNTLFPARRASCRDRTDDLPLTRRPLWPSELKRHNPNVHKQCCEQMTSIPVVPEWSIRAEAGAARSTPVLGHRPGRCIRRPLKSACRPRRLKASCLPLPPGRRPIRWT